LAALGARRQLHYPKETKLNDNPMSPSRGRSCYCDTHIQSQYSKHPPPSYREMDTSYCNHRSTPNSLGSQEPNRQMTKRRFIHEHI